MCTALSYRTKHHYFGRNLDLERGYGEQVVITPRNYPFTFRHRSTQNRHYALIGMAAVMDDYPLYFEATNEKGLSMAGLNFPGNAVYGDYVEGKENMAPFELIPYLLGACATAGEAKTLLEQVNVLACNFRADLPATPLHWLISDRESSLVLECTKTGLQVWENPFGVLTNNPTFDWHRTNLGQYMHLHEGAAENRFSAKLPLENFSLGMGAVGLPGDFSSPSRFVRAVFVKEKSLCDGTEQGSVVQFFRILQSVAMPKGCVQTPDGQYEYTRYSCCCDTDTGVFYYTTYDNMTLRKVELSSIDPEGDSLHCHPI